MANSSCRNDSAGLIRPNTSSITEIVYSTAGVDSDTGIDYSDYINYKDLWEETGVSTKTEWVPADVT